MPSSPRTMTDAAMLDRARRALGKHAWPEACESFSPLDADGSLGAEDLERLGEAAWWSAHPKESLDAFKRAYAACLSEGNARRAAFVAVRLANEYLERRDSALWNGWIRRAGRLLEDRPEGVEHGTSSSSSRAESRCSVADRSLIERDKPGTVVFLQYSDEANTELHVVHVFPDADAMARHLEGADDRVARAVEFIDTVGYEIYGSPSDPVLKRMQGFAEHAGATLTVRPHHVAGYLRPAMG